MDLIKTMLLAFIFSCIIVGCSTYGLALNDFDHFNFSDSAQNSAVLDN